MTESEEIPDEVFNNLYIQKTPELKFKGGVLLNRNGHRLTLSFPVDLVLKDRETKHKYLAFMRCLKAK